MYDGTTGFLTVAAAAAAAASPSVVVNMAGVVVVLSLVTPPPSLMVRDARELNDGDARTKLTTPPRFDGGSSCGTGCRSTLGDDTGELGTARELSFDADARLSACDDGVTNSPSDDGMRFSDPNGWNLFLCRPDGRSLPLPLLPPLLALLPPPPPLLL